MKHDRALLKQLSKYMSLGLMLPISTFIGYAIGFYLDKWLGTNWLYLVFLLLGIASGMISLIRELNKEQPK